MVSSQVQGVREDPSTAKYINIYLKAKFMPNASISPTKREGGRPLGVINLAQKKSRSQLGQIFKGSYETTSDPNSVCT